MVAIAAARGGEWWPRNRRSGEGKKRFTSFSASRPGSCSAKLLETMADAAMCLFCPSAPVRRAVPVAGQMVSDQGRTCTPERLWQCWRAFLRRGQDSKRAHASMPTPRALGNANLPRERALWALWALRRRNADIQLLHAVSRLQNATWAMCEVSGWQRQGQCMMLCAR